MAGLIRYIVNRITTVYPVNKITAMKLYQLLYGKSKKRLKPIMVDSKHKCENYRDARQNVKGWHEIVEAPPGAEVWRQKTCTVGGNKCQTVGVVGWSPSGWIGKNGFNPHT